MIVIGEDFYERRSYDELVRRAAELNCEPVFSDGRTLLIDIDEPFSEALAPFRESMSFLQDIGLLPLDVAVETWVSKGGNLHAKITAPGSYFFGDAEHRIALQGMLGSDDKREALALRDVLAGHENPIVLFRPKVRQ